MGIFDSKSDSSQAYNGSDAAGQSQLGAVNTKSQTLHNANSADGTFQDIVGDVFSSSSVLAYSTQNISYRQDTSYEDNSQYFVDSSDRSQEFIDNSSMFIDNSVTTDAGLVAASENIAMAAINGLTGNALSVVKLAESVLTFGGDAIKKTQESITSAIAEIQSDANQDNTEKLIYVVGGVAAVFSLSALFGGKND
ncbi:hypothetical protein JYT97_00010 [Haliea sp. AH-315-K21]|uniref:Uncharacterized protein n=1 Tax=SAR86 cluster bacterium TaxID=2030880 RepID=A0A2A5CEZ6_9GAMM|nr:hypothetical protein [Haliea sp. AH-315-K21]PCJ42088.1 MAG: hypothetical protein COA71_05715 [SAR86 cluster bacterium]